MKGEGNEGKHSGRGRRGYEYIAPATVLVTGLLATALLEWRYEDETRSLHFLVIFVWLFLIAGTTVGLAYSERRRRQAETAVGKAYREMEEQVRIRTAELSDANRSLEEEIAERKRAEISLRMSEGEYRRLSAQFRILLDTIPDALLLVSRDLKVMWSNKGATAFSQSNPAGIRCHELFHGSSSPCAACPAVKSYESGHEENIQTSTPDGRQWDIRAVPVRREDGMIEGVIEVATDITEKVALHRETMRAAHLASLGELSAGVAHEINNPINGIINYAQILYNRSDPENNDREIAGRILKEGHRIADIVSGLLSFARVRKEEKERAFVGDILGEALSLTQSQMGKEGIRVLTAVPSVLPQVVANPQQIMQVFLNILSNARYALNEKFPGPHEDKILEILAEPAEGDGGPCVRMTFRDWGTGIPASLMYKVTTPFFTTKPGGKGTGLGLSICAGIVSDHGGKLALESVEGKFTKVTVDLPVAGGGNGKDPRH